MSNTVSRKSKMSVMLSLAILRERNQVHRTRKSVNEAEEIISSRQCSSCEDQVLSTTAL
jgi:hypothetical protein